MFERPMILFIRKPYVIGAIITLFLLLGAGSLKMTSVLSPGLKDKIIIIDPGHGGADPGAQSTGLQEKDLNLDISLRLRKALELKGCRAILTRETDKDFFLPGFVKGRMAKRAELNNRIRIAAENNADLFISIHANSFPQRNSYGMETYYHLQSPAGKALAEIIHEQLALVQPDNKRQAKAGDYYLLNQTEIPAVIVEVGFISNSKERKLLLSVDYRSQIASAIGSGVENYFKAYPRGVPDSAPATSQDEPPAIKGNTYKLYFPNETLDTLIPENRQLNPALWSKLDLAQKANLILSELIQGPLSGKLTPTIAPATKILAITVQNEIATIDLSKDIQDNFLGGASGEELTLRSIVWSMTQIPGISKVRILVNGESGDSIGGQIFLDRTFSSQLGV